MCRVSILFKSVIDAKFEPSKVIFLRLMPSTVLNHRISIVLNIFFDVFLSVRKKDSAVEYLQVWTLWTGGSSKIVLRQASKPGVCSRRLVEHPIRQAASNDSALRSSGAAKRKGSRSKSSLFRF